MRHLDKNCKDCVFCALRDMRDGRGDVCDNKNECRYNPPSELCGGFPCVDPDEDWCSKLLTKEELEKVESERIQLETRTKAMLGL